MAEPAARKTEQQPEGRGCLFFSLAVLLIVLIAFGIAAWVSAPNGTAGAGAEAGGPATAPQR